MAATIAQANPRRKYARRTITTVLLLRTRRIGGELQKPKRRQVSAMPAPAVNSNYLTERVQGSTYTGL